MSLSSSLNNALSGLNVASRAASVVSSNVANATTEGYAPRQIEVSSRVVGQVGAGVAVDGVTRIVDEQLLQDRRLADADAGEAEVLSDFYSSFEALIGDPGDVGSLSATISDLEASLISAASTPESEVRLQEVLDSAKDLTTKLNSATDQIQDIRLQADDSIQAHVENLNANLEQLDELNELFVKLTSSGEDTNAIADKRQAIIDDISSIIPIEVHDRSLGQVALYTPGGVKLIDGTVAEIEYTGVGTIVPEMTIEGGALSGIIFDGREVDFSSSSSVVSGGSLSAAFQVRDELTVEAQADLDAIARDLVERFAAADSSVSGGLLTDAGADFDPADEVGLAGRLSVHSGADPDEGGHLWAIRDGLGATLQGSVGDSSLILDLTAALTDPKTASSGSFSGSLGSSLDLVSDVLSLASTNRQNSEANMSFSLALQEGLLTQELENGVDTDHELQKLLLIEQSFTANAKVMQTIDELIGQLLEL